jgi:hypothetical protein
MRDGKDIPIMSSGRTQRSAAVLATIIFAAFFVFQVLLAAGAPLGRAAYGGRSDILSPALRIMSVVSALIFLGAIRTVLVRSGILAAGRRAQSAARWLLWGLVVLFGLSLAANVTSSSPWERFLMAPLALVIVVCCIIVALGSREKKI